ncbi:MAG: hypothetical protein NTW03_03005 [Verrucomicrobia bacterium]|nr:hypothetical protein [Verrucomicrobiota bacterium]
MSIGAAYPSRPEERSRWILARRPPRQTTDPYRPGAFFLEQEPDERGGVAETATLLLTNRECPWRCLMCDLWKNTLSQTVPRWANLR